MKFHSNTTYTTNTNKYNNNHNNHNNHNNYNNNYNKANRYSELENDSDSDSVDINNKYKSHLLDFLYNKIEVGEHKYTVIKGVGDIYDLKSKKYYASINSCGINSFIVFTKKDDNYYSFMVDRRSISYNRQSLKKEAVRLTEVKLAVDPKIFDGTILDGVLIDSESNIIGSKTDKTKPKMQFMVNDVFMLAGKSLITTDYKKKMFMVSNMFKQLVGLSDKSNNIDLYISRPYELNQTQALFRDYIQPNIKKYNIKGISFYPQYSGTKIIYVFDKQDEKFKNELLTGDAIINTDPENNVQLIDSPDKKTIFKFELMNPECIDDIILNLEMTKTVTPDVYKLFGIFHNINPKTKEEQYIKKKIGIAYVPTYILSLKCKLYFINKNSLIMSCKFNANKNKWIPIDEAEVQKIDIINNEKRIKIIEQEVIDNDIEQVDNEEQD